MSRRRALALAMIVATLIAAILVAGKLAELDLEDLSR